STKQSSIAICVDGQVRGEYTWYSNNNHSTELLRNVQHLMSTCQCSLAQLDAMAVATGPGSFNGVRVAMVTAKSLAFALQKPLLGVSTLDAAAFQQRLWRGPICSVQEAGRSELYAACYRFDVDTRPATDAVATSTMQLLGDYVLMPPQELAAYVREHATTWFEVPDEQHMPQLLFCGEISATARQILHAQLGERCFFADDLSSTRHASALAALALQRLQSGTVDDPLSLEPLYLRRPSITTSTRKRSLFGGDGERTTGHDTTTEREEGALRH
ncbi:MAG TPA: tRNA (adenosine(37)-N6)-threonylcarbamoyltransferase complex dimerization subunit type 1 TsaB, partial [Ktedonobacteraceae bacterium]|nr:tRNA (adenosine(37)-N6)-threonylcarbamoyltransferase complex dimerization subunit type 1 TsaB [Ktedonobacteraceae bacterium]